MGYIELSYEELEEHEGHDLTVEISDDMSLYCRTCNRSIASIDFPSWTATIRLVGTAYVTRTAANEDAMRQMVEDMYFPGDEDDIEIMVDDIEIEEA